MSLTRRKFVQLFATLALAFSLSSVVAPAAFADVATSADIVASSDAATVDVGNQLAMAGYFTVSNVLPEGADYHIDYVITDGASLASINKHNGTLTATLAGDVDVTAYVTAMAKPSSGGGNSSSLPCATTVASATKTVTVNDPTAYGWQGTGDNQIKLTSHTIANDAWSYDSTTNTYTNNLGTLTAVDGYYTFTYQTASGFNSYGTADEYDAYEAGMIKLYKGTGSGRNLVATLHDTFVRTEQATDEEGNLVYDEDGNPVMVDIYAPNSNLFISSVDKTNKLVTVKVAATALNAHNAYLVFEPGLKANQPSKTLGSTVEFVFAH